MSKNWVEFSLDDMANPYGISDRDERRIRARDKRCVYCGVTLRKSSWGDYPTIEHFNNDGPFDHYGNIAMCCRACNGSKGVTTLLVWLDSPYCQRKGISRARVAAVVRRYLQVAHKSSNQTMQPTARRRTASLSMTKKPGFQASLAPTSGG